ncbi:hypothetical protein BaRGS_00036788 [Batillaria attramentaria]|uniref:ZU5 domain-containing protein n=1 Tax=Batillaria attramentaria TaxID=370345 RepID=A0ABD0JAG6_9CAEN
MEGKTTEKSRKPMFEKDWHFQEDFDGAGREIRGPSKVTLFIPKNAVQDGNQITIKGAVSTDYERMHQTLGLSDDEMIVSPVVELDVEQKLTFRKPVRIILPILPFLRTDIPSEQFSVVRLSREDFNKGDMQGEELRLQTDCGKQDEDGVFYLSREDGEISVYVTHFTRFWTKIKDIFQSPDRCLHLELHGKRERRKETQDAVLSLYIFRKDYYDIGKLKEEYLTDDEKKKGQLDTACISIISGQDVELGAHVQLREECGPWQPVDFPQGAVRGDGYKKSMDVQNRYKHFFKMRWVFRTISEKETDFTCDIEVGYLNKTGSTGFQFLTTLDIESLSASLPEVSPIHVPPITALAYKTDKNLARSKLISKLHTAQPTAGPAAEIRLQHTLSWPPRHRGMREKPSTLIIPAFSISGKLERYERSTTGAALNGSSHSNTAM